MPGRASHSRGKSPAYGKPERIASPLQIMIDGPLGGAAFNNEFGRPNLGGYFRTYEQNVGATALGDNTVFGYHKPIMIAGGIGNISAQHTHKNDIPVGSLLIQLGGPGMRIGLGGGAASSMATGTNTADLDFDSVQRGNPEMERRAQEVINACWQLGDAQPDHLDPRRRRRRPVERLPRDHQRRRRGATFDLRKVPLEERGMSPREIWCNESQERYVLAIAPDDLARFAAICERERCPFAAVGVATEERQLQRDRPAARQQRRSTCRWTSCSASRRRCSATSTHVQNDFAAGRPDRPRPGRSRAPRAAAARPWPTNPS